VSQVRVVQRNVRRLEQLGLVNAYHACAGFVDRLYTQWNGQPGVMPQAVAALAVSFRWDCQHFAEQNKIASDFTNDRAAALAKMLEDPVAAMQGLLQ
jgi:hypothetical protein